jgi:hypothetical protein
MSKPKKLNNFFGTSSNASSRHWLRDLRLYRFHDRLKGFRLTDRKFGKHLTVEFNTRFRETIDEARIGKSVFAHRRVEPLARRSRVAYCIERSTAAFAARIVFLRRP